MFSFLDFDIVPLWEAVLRVLLAAGIGLAVGLDRDLKRKPIDFRAFIIIATTSCVIAMMAQEVFEDYRQAEESVSLDFMAAVEGVLAGIGFLGAGAIMRSGDSGLIVGTATGASIWASGGLGLTLGFGFYGLALIGFLAVFGSLFLLGFLMPLVSDERDDQR